MRALARKAVSEIEVGEKGRITMPASFRKAHRLAKGSRVFALEVGGTLMLLPEDDELEQLSREMRDTLARKGITRTQLHRDLPRIRKEQLKRLYVTSDQAWRATADSRRGCSEPSAYSSRGRRSNPALRDGREA